MISPGNIITSLYQKERRKATLKGRCAGRSMAEPGAETEGPWDLVVVGGGEVGLAAAREAARLGRRVAVVARSSRSARGTTCGLGGGAAGEGGARRLARLLGRAAQLGVGLKDAAAYGWDGTEGARLQWPRLTARLATYFACVDRCHRRMLSAHGVRLLEARGRLEGAGVVAAEAADGSTQRLKAQHVLLATGSEARPPDLALAPEDLPALPRAPDRALVLGGSLEALELAAGLQGLGVDCTVLTSGPLLPGLDSQMAELVLANMAAEGVHFSLGFSVTSMERAQAPPGPQPLQAEGGESPGAAAEPWSGPVRVVAQPQPGALVLAAARPGGGEDTFEEEPSTDRPKPEAAPAEPLRSEYDLVLFAAARAPVTAGLGLDTAAVSVDPQSGRVQVDAAGLTSCPGVHALGGVSLAPAPGARWPGGAQRAGQQLARRLFGAQAAAEEPGGPAAGALITPIEYAWVGLSEQDAENQFGRHDVEVYHTHFTPLELALPARGDNSGYAKLVCVKSEAERVVGLHFLAPFAAEAVHGFAVALRRCPTRAQVNTVVGIHPTCAEELTSLAITKASGLSVIKTAC